MSAGPPRNQAAKAHESNFSLTQGAHRQSTQNACFFLNLKFKTFLFIKFFLDNFTPVHNAP